MKQCFVIMPYGRSDEEKHHFDGVFLTIVKPAAEQAGCKVKRSDIAGEPGNITQDIIKDLASAEIVIADLTGGNPNVFLELGIRHVLRKSGTIHIIDITEEIPFDIRAYRTVKYSTQLAEIPSVIGEIVEQIGKREDQIDRSDNPVHDTLIGLPVDYLATTDEAVRSSLEHMQRTITELETSNEELARRLSELDPDVTSTPADEINVDNILDEADEIMQATGVDALLRLQQAMETDGRDGFVAALREVLKSKYLGENDFSGIAVLCGELGLPDHRRATLEVAARKYSSEHFQIMRAVSYIDSPSLSLQERGRLLLEDMLDVEHGDDGPVLLSPPTVRSAYAVIGSLLNDYNRKRRWEWVVSLCSSAEEIIGSDSVFLRNRALAIARLGDKPAAEEVFKQAIEADPSDDTAHAFYSDFLEDEKRYLESYREHEIALRLDPDDPTRWMNLAIFIINRGFCRKDEGKDIQNSLSEVERKKYAIPLLQKAIDVSHGSTETRREVVTILARGKALREAKAISEGSVVEDEFEIVEWVLSGEGSSAAPSSS